MTSIKGFIKNYKNEILLPITRAELVKDSAGITALRSQQFCATTTEHGLMSPDDKKKLDNISGAGNLATIAANIIALSTSIKINDVPLNLLSKPLNIKNSNEIIAAYNTNNGTLTYTIGTNLTDKTLVNAMVSQAPTKDLGVANKQYVDKAVAGAIGISTGALKYQGVVSNADGITKTEGFYYKVASPFTLDNDVSVKIGDTLIIHNDAIEHIPSGDEVETLVTVGDTSMIGNILFEGQAPLVVEANSQNNKVTFKLPQVSSSSPGYLTSDDYNIFKAIADTGVNYVQVITEGTLLGTLNKVPIMAPRLAVEKSKIKLGDDAITLIGNGITISGNNSGSFTFQPNIHTDSQQFLKIENNQIKLNVWSNTNNDTNSLVTFGSFAAGIVDHVSFVSVTSDSLTDDEKEYLIY
jgi:hypothetical protein